MIEFRPLMADEIEVRVAIVRDNGVSLLLYKDARCDMNILDQTVGPFGWKREHTRDNANCIVSIWDEEKQQWINKEDTGTESRADGEGNEKKGLASDSFKRACFNWGIGRELYTAPFIWIRPEDVGIFKGNNNKPTTRDRFSVAEIEVVDKKIRVLKIKNNTKNKIVFTYGVTSTKKDELKAETEEILKSSLSEPKINLLKKEVQRIGMTDAQFLGRYKKNKYEDFTEDEWQKLYPALQKIN